MAESFFSTLEAELLSRCRFASPAEAKMACFQLHRRLVQPGQAAFSAGIPIPNGLRNRNGGCRGFQSAQLVPVGGRSCERQSNVNIPASCIGIGTDLMSQTDKLLSVFL